MHRRLLLPLVGLALAILGLTAMGRYALGAAAAGGPADGHVWLLSLAAAFLFAVGAVGMLHASQVALRVVGPEVRLIESLRRMRTGDLSFRVHLRRGDLLAGLAKECNELLEWLNANPPSGAATGSDVVEVERMELETVEAAS